MSEYRAPLGEFQPPDPPEEDIDAKWDRWFDQQERNGYAVISRADWREKLDETARDGYADGRSDERDALLPALRQVRNALKEAELLLSRAYSYHGLSLIDDGEGAWVDVDKAADRMCKTIDALDDAVGAI